MQGRGAREGSHKEERLGVVLGMKIQSRPCPKFHSRIFSTRTGVGSNQLSHPGLWRPAQKSQSLNAWFHGDHRHSFSETARPMQPEKGQRPFLPTSLCGSSVTVETAKALELQQ